MNSGCQVWNLGLMVLLALSSGNHVWASNTDPPPQPVKLIFTHHSTGENWLVDEDGDLVKHSSPTPQVSHKCLNNR